MNKEINFETFLFVGFKKFIISVNRKDTFKTVHQKEIKLEQNFSYSVSSTNFALR